MLRCFTIVFILFHVCFGVQVWETKLDQSSLMKRLADPTIVSGTSTNSLIVSIKSTQYQEIYGFGASLTEASAYNFIQLKNTNNANYKTVLNKLFSNSSGIGLSVIRVPMGSTDMSLSPSFTYDETSNDWFFSDWSWNRDATYVLPVLKDIVSINPSIKILLTPWSAPTWMKTSAGYSNAFMWGTLQDSKYDDYAYFIQYTIQKYLAEGITVTAVTLQNEPLNSPNNYPVMGMTPQNQSFLAKTLGVKLANNNLATKILVFDHNWDNYQYPITALSDTTAVQYITGSAFHCYGGTVDQQLNVYNAFPNKEIWFTECSGTGNSSFSTNIQWNTNTLYFGVIKNWARTVMHWNLALDTSDGPHTGGCSNCRGVITVKPNNVDVVYNEEYWGMGMFSKFLVAPAHRLDCGLTGGYGCVSNLCILNGNGAVLVVVANFCQTPQVAAIQKGSSYVQITANVGITTFVW